MSTSLHWGSERERRRPFAIEWLYFKFFSPSVDGIIVFGCGWGLPGVIMAQIFRRNGAGPEPPVSVARHDYSSAAVWRSTTSFDCRIDESAVTTSGAGYGTSGTVADGEHAIEWQLDFAALHSAFPSFRARSGWLPASSLHWYLLAPLAAASGQVVVDGEVLPVTGQGYVDSNGGRWLFALDPSTHWNWTMVYDVGAGDDLVAVGMNLRTSPRRGGLHLRAQGLACDFPTDERTFEHLAFGADTATGTRLPTATRVHARNRAGDKLELLLENEIAHVYRQAIPPRELRGPLPTCAEWHLGECFVSATGSLTTAHGTRTIQARGIKEYPVTRLAPWR